MAWSLLLQIWLIKAINVVVNTQFMDVIGGTWSLKPHIWLLKFQIWSLMLQKWMLKLQTWSLMCHIWSLKVRNMVVNASW